MHLRLEKSPLFFWPSVALSETFAGVEKVGIRMLPCKSRHAQTDVCTDACDRKTHSKTRKLKLLKLDAVILPTNKEELNTEKVSQQAIMSWMSPVS